METGADGLKAGHRGVTDLGALNRTQKHPQAQSSPLEGSTDLPFDSYPPIR